MSHDTYFPPTYMGEAFHCVFCGIKTTQSWSNVYYHNTRVYGWNICKCDHCGEYSLWVEKILTYPNVAGAPMPHKDMPESVRDLYNEARDISARSPRSAAVLLRIATEVLCKQLGEESTSLNKAIGNLQKKHHLPKPVIQALDVIRMYGNDSAHLGVMNLEDGADAVNGLFQLINTIVVFTIERDNVIGDLIEKLPESQQQIIHNRDKGE